MSALAAQYDTTLCAQQRALAVFKPCAATLLRGAVAVGRVTSRVKNDAASTADCRINPFDAYLLRCLETQCSASK